MATTAGRPWRTRGLRHPGEGVAAGGAGTLAGVEDGELQGAGVMQQGAETGAGDEVGGAVAFALEDEDAFLGGVVEAAVADEVEDVEVLEQGPLEGGEGGLGEDHEVQLA